MMRGRKFKSVAIRNLRILLVARKMPEMRWSSAICLEIIYAADKFVIFSILNTKFYQSQLEIGKVVTLKK